MARHRRDQIGKQGLTTVLTRFLGEQLGFGALIGLGIGLVGGWLLGVAQRRNWMATKFRQLGLVTLPLLCVMASEATGASMFIAAFVAGLLVQVSFAHLHTRTQCAPWDQSLCQKNRISG